MPHFIITPHLYNFRELPSTYHSCGLLEVGASRVILRQPTFISHLLIGLSPFTFLEDGRLLSEKNKNNETEKLPCCEHYPRKGFPAYFKTNGMDFSRIGMLNSRTVFHSNGRVT